MVSLSCIGEGNGNLLQCSFLEDPRDREAWWAAVYVVAQSRTRLKRLSSSNSSSRQLLPDQTILEGKGGDGVFLNFALRKITRDSSCGHL